MTKGQTIKQVIELDADFLARTDERLERMEKALQNLNILNKPEPEYLTPNEFVKKIKSSRWMYDQLLAQGLLEVKRIGRKVFIRKSMVDKWWAGELVSLN